MTEVDFDPIEDFSEQPVTGVAELKFSATAQDSESASIQECSPDQSRPQAALDEIEELKSNLKPQLERILKTTDAVNPQEGGLDSKGNVISTDQGDTSPEPRVIALRT